MKNKKKKADSTAELSVFLCTNTFKVNMIKSQWVGCARTSGEDFGLWDTFTKRSDAPDAVRSDSKSD